MAEVVAVSRWWTGRRQQDVGRRGTGDWRVPELEADSVMVTVPDARALQVSKI